MEAPNAWRRTTRSERWPLRRVMRRTVPRAFISNLLPGVGMYRAGLRLEGARVIIYAIGLVVAAFALTSANLLPDGSPGKSPTLSLLINLAALGYLYLFLCAVHRTIGARLSGRFPEVARDMAAWLHRRAIHERSCPRCGEHDATVAGFCAACSAALTPRRIPSDDPRVRAADGFSWPGDAALHDRVAPTIEFHNQLGVSAMASHRALACGIEAGLALLTDATREVTAAYEDPLDPDVVWLRRIEDGTLSDGARMHCDDVVRGRFEGGVLQEKWEFGRMQVGAPEPLAPDHPRLVAAEPTI